MTAAGKYNAAAAEARVQAAAIARERAAVLLRKWSRRYAAQSETGNPERWERTCGAFDAAARLYHAAALEHEAAIAELRRVLGVPMGRPLEGGAHAE